MSQAKPAKIISIYSKTERKVVELKARLISAGIDVGYITQGKDYKDEYYLQVPTSQVIQANALITGLKFEVAFISDDDTPIYV